MTHNTTGGRAVCLCQTGAHSQEIVPLFNNHFSVVYWPGDNLLFLFIYPPLINLSPLDKTHVVG
jgi:hypothetical protein